MAVDTVAIVFVRVDFPPTDYLRPQSLLVHSGIGTYADREPWKQYVGAGELLRLSDIEEASSTNATSFSFGVRIADEFVNSPQSLDLIEAIERTQVQNAPVLVHGVENLTHGASAEPELLLAGRVDRVEIEPTSITVHVFTPSVLLDKVVNFPASYTDLEHRRYTDDTDRCLRFITGTPDDRDSYFP